MCLVIKMDFSKECNIENCPCGKEHSFGAKVIAQKGAIDCLPEELCERNIKKVFLLADKNTYKSAGERVSALIRQSAVEVCEYVFESDIVEPDERYVGLAVMHYQNDCDAVVGVGSGVVNDISKIVAAVSGKPYIIVATAPSMDGYASSTSSMTRGGLKISLQSKCADVIIGDIDILAAAPQKLLLSGLGDMLAKYVSICEWRISALINGEYFCEHIAEMVRAALKKCVDNADGLLRRDEQAVCSVFEGLVFCGAAMKLAGVSRPASGIEHYLSHVWDMRAAEFGTAVELHGIQCAVGTLIAVELYEKLLKITPDRQKAKSYAEGFDYAAHSAFLRKFLGRGAEDMIALEAKEQKYSVQNHSVRIEKITEDWDSIVKIVKQELPEKAELLALFEKLCLPKTTDEMGIPSETLKHTFSATKDIRDKYVLSRLCWDLGVIDDIM